MSDGQPIGVLRPPIGPGNEGKLYAAALTPQGDLAALGGWSADNDVYIFRRDSGASVLRLGGMPNAINRLAFFAGWENAGGCALGRPRHPRIRAVMVGRVRRCWAKTAPMRVIRTASASAPMGGAW
ncbi:MAG: hypothetical protein IPN64_00165 [Propionivibrio sp.]|uniref:hypothetical protein n=1 Tax=Propionivibrio sp. TaxID=2212460 RepID=UPI0025D647CF|nr:hypothetical protein [Propionivibrio sp.]MBK8892513.1 hypothetical protein [Propionivibrio sp.]